MTLHLAWEELLRHGSDIVVAFVCMVPMAVILSLSWGRVGLLLTAPIAVTFASIAYCQRTAYKDDKAGLLMFLKALPIGSSQLIQIRALSSTAVVLMNSVLAPLLAFIVLRFSRGGTLPVPWIRVASWSFILGLALMAFCNAVYFRFGGNAVTTTLSVLMIVSVIPGMLLKSKIASASTAPVFASSIGRIADWTRTHQTLATAALFAFAAAFAATCWVYAYVALQHKEML